jgi:hypothetical protein
MGGQICGRADMGTLGHSQLSVCMAVNFGEDCLSQLIDIQVEPVFGPWDLG